MIKFIVNQSPPLCGGVRVGGSKNAVLPIIAAALLTPETVRVLDVPALSDVFCMRNIIEALGGKTRHDQRAGALEIKCGDIEKFEAPYELTGKMRASFLVMGPLLARTGAARLPMPGGCSIGARPVDLHLKGFAAMGAEIESGHGYVEARARRLRGANIYLDFPSVGATENLIMAACLADGQTILQNVAIEPEIVDLANFLTAIGADIRGAGTTTIRVNGLSPQESLRGAVHTVIPDRIEAGTFMVAAAATGGDVFLDNVVADHLKPVIAKLGEANVMVDVTESGMRVCAKKGGLKAIDVKTLPYPGFPTDMQAQFMAMLATAPGLSVMVETVFENRFMHVGELSRMGANIKIEGRGAVVEGVRSLSGAQTKATDLRAGAALVIAALCAQGETIIEDGFHLERGYERFDEKLRALGANVTKIGD